MTPTCPLCGTAVSTGGGRCPVCGTELPELRAAPGTAAAVGVARRRTEAARKGRLPWAAWILAAVVALAVGGIAWRTLLARPPAPPPDVPTTSAPAPTVLPGELDPMVALADATRRARSWSPEAQLLEVEVRGVVLGRVQQAEGGRVIATFSTSPKLAPGKPSSTKRWQVEVDGAGIDERAASGVGTLAREPNCTVHEAWRKAHAAGLPDRSPARLVYAWSAKHDREIWTVTSGADVRLLDGQTCAVVAP